MSLKSHLRDKHSPVSAFFAREFPNAAAVLQPLRAQIAAAGTIRPAQPLPCDVMGMALDYRLRYYFKVTPWEDLIASSGADITCGAMWWGGLDDRPEKALPEALIADYRDALEGALRDLQPAGRRLEETQEAMLARHCIVLALFEVAFREGMERTALHSPLFVPEPKTSVAELLAIPSEHWIADLCSLSWGFHDQCSDLLQQPVVLNPTFAGSGDVGGADADLIVGDCLVEIKATVDPLRLDRWRETVYQLLGYALLDYDDEQKIRQVGVYLARQRLLLKWPLDDLMTALAGKPVPLLAAVRTTFRGVLSALPGSAKGISVKL